MSQLFTPEYDSQGYPLLDEQDQEFMRVVAEAGLLLVGDPGLEAGTRPVTAEDDVDYYIAQLEHITEATSALSMPLGMAMGQTALRPSEEGLPLDIFLAKIDPDKPEEVTDQTMPFLNFRITDTSSTLQELKHACYATGPLSPITATPQSIRFTTLNRHMEEISGTFTGTPAAIAWHEWKHNLGELMVNQAGVSVVNCVPMRHLELSRKTSVEDSKTKWPLRYTARQIANILSGEHQLY